MDQITNFFSPRAYEIIGVAGFALYVLNYTLLTFQIVCARHLTYFVINLAASSFVLISLSHNFNLASALIQGFWIVISITAITLRVGRSRGKARWRQQTV